MFQTWYENVRRFALARPRNSFLIGMAAALLVWIVCQVVFSGPKQPWPYFQGSVRPTEQFFYIVTWDGERWRCRPWSDVREMGFNYTPPPPPQKQ